MSELITVRRSAARHGRDIPPALQRAYTVPISEAQAKRLAVDAPGSVPLRLGTYITVRAHQHDSGCWSRLKIANVGGRYYLTSFDIPVSMWLRAFNVRVPSCLLLQVPRDDES